MSGYSALDQTLAQIGRKTLIMGILNVTPDSFSDGGLFVSPQVALDRAQQMLLEGADIVDIGGESTRPGSARISVEEELHRVIPIIELLAGNTCAPISVDTYKAAVAREALKCGATIINDISAATFDPQMPDLMAETKCGAVLMHIPGSSHDMHHKPQYEDVVLEVSAFLSGCVSRLLAAGAQKSRMLIDPGFGFGKTVSQNLELIRRLAELKSVGLPILVGTSRKSTIGAVLGGLPPEERIEGTAATVAIAIANGADVIRVHDVREMSRVARVADAIVRGQYSET